jgi:hypothetical protein
MRFSKMLLMNFSCTDNHALASINTDRTSVSEDVGTSAVRSLSSACWPYCAASATMDSEDNDDGMEIAEALAQSLLSDVTQTPDCRAVAAELAISISSAALRSDLDALTNVTQSAGITFRDRLQLEYPHGVAADILKELDAVYTKGLAFKGNATYVEDRPFTASRVVQSLADTVTTHVQNARKMLDEEKTRLDMKRRPGKQNQYEALHGVAYCLTQIDCLITSALDRRNELIRAATLYSQQNVKCPRFLLINLPYMLVTDAIDIIFKTYSSARADCL